MFFNKIYKSLYYYFFEVKGNIFFKLKYFFEKVLQYFITVINHLFNVNINYPFLFKDDYILENNIGKFYIKSGSDYDYPIQPYVEDDHEKLWTIDDGMIFIDIGAHVGDYSIKVNHFNKNKNIDIYLFEPHPATFTYMTKNIEINNLNNFKPINYGVSNKKGILKFTNSDFRYAAVAKIIDDDNLDSSGSIDIKVISLDNFIEDNNIDCNKISLIKIDVEGHEVNVLEGMINILNENKNIKIICEILEKDKLNLITNNIKSFGFNIISVDETNYYISNNLKV